MKSVILFIFLITAYSFSNNTNPTTVTNVTVYLSGAQVTRTTVLKVPIGTAEFTFDKLSSDIDQSSIQVSGLENTTILSINYGINYLSNHEQSVEIEQLKSKIKTLNDKIQLEEDVIAGYTEELLVIQSNRQLGNNNQVVELEKLKQFTSYYRKRITEIKNEIYLATKKKSESINDLLKINKQLEALHMSEKIPTGEITLKLNSERASTLQLLITYYVSNAGWFPIYDLKADKIDQPLQLAYKAHVYQTTGSDWNNIKLSLSTSDPHTNNMKPEILPHYLNYLSPHSNYQRNRATKAYNYKYNPTVTLVSGIVTDEAGVPIPGVNVIEKGSTNGTSTDFDGRYMLKIKEGKELEYSYIGYQNEVLPIYSTLMNLIIIEDQSQLDEVVVTAMGYSRTSTRPQKENIESFTTEVEVEQGIANTRFDIKKSQSIPTSKNVSVIEIDLFSMPVTYSYFAAPVLNENVFLTAKIGNWEQYNLLPAEANVYFEGSYSGKTNINPLAIGDSLTISLGVDPNVVVKRTELTDFKKNQYVGNNRITTKTYEIEVKNNKPSSIEMILFDRIPISQNRDIKVSDIDSGSSIYDDEKGIMKWKVNLSKNSSTKEKFSYKIKYPKFRKVNL